MVYKTTLPSVPIPDIDLYSFLVSPNEFNTNRDLNAPIVIEGATGKSLSWNTIKEQSRLLGTGWQENVGLKPGDTVAVFAPNQLDHVILVLSLLAAKVTISPG
jgi:acyl-CoA synthetase (AMP-forming)/AMP-acid ligase II